MNGHDSIDRLRADLLRRGQDPDVVGWAGDPALPLIDGVELVRPRGDGIEVVMFERGREFNPRYYANESEAAAALRTRLRRLETKAAAGTGETQAEIRERMQQRAAETLRRLEGRRGDPR